MQHGSEDDAGPQFAVEDARFLPWAAGTNSFVIARSSGSVGVIGFLLAWLMDDKNPPVNQKNAGMCTAVVVLLSVKPS